MTSVDTRSGSADTWLVALFWALVTLLGAGPATAEPDSTSTPGAPTRGASTPGASTPGVPTPGPDATATILPIETEGTVVRLDEPTLLPLATSVVTLDGSTRTVVEDGTVSLELAADVFFGFDRAQLEPAAGAVLDDVVRRLAEADVETIDVVGHTDDVGSEDYNLELSRRRAEAVRVALLAREPSLSVETEGRGERDPVAPNQVDGVDDEVGRARNRRVEVRYTDPGGTPPRRLSQPIG